MHSAHKHRRALMALGIILVSCHFAFALNPSLDINQYAHTAWTVREGFFKGVIYSIAQTPDGYLWLGTEFGLLRFDGVRSVPWQPPAGEHLPSSYIRSLLAARDGRLWIGTAKGLASWKDGKLTQLSGVCRTKCCLRSSRIVKERYGPAGRRLHWETLRDSEWQRPVLRRGRQSRPRSPSLYEDSRGNLWAGASTGLWRWKPGPPKLYPMPEPMAHVSGLIEGDNGALLIATASAESGQLVDGKAEAYPLPGVGWQFMPGKLLRDRDGGLWIGTTDQGLLHVHQGRTDVFARSDGLSGD